MKDKQVEVEQLLGKLDETRFSQVVRLSQAITDYGKDEVRIAASLSLLYNFYLSLVCLLRFFLSKAFHF